MNQSFGLCVPVTRKPGAVAPGLRGAQGRGHARPGAFLAALLGTSVLAAPAALRAQAIVADGSTATGIQTSGATTDITTGTIHGGLGFNSFSRLDVAAGHTVSIHAPAGTTGTVNLVRDRASLIEGTLQGMLGGAVGGSLVLANPNGIVVGPDGQISAGSVSLSTPDAGFVAGFFGPDGTPAPGRAQALIDGSAPRADADVVVHGRITGPDGVSIRAGRDVVIGDTSASGRAAAVSAVAATGGRRAIVLDAGRDVAVHGTLRAATGEAGGSIEIRAGRDATISGMLDAAGRGDGAGGAIRLLAERAAWLTPTGSVLAHAPGAGDGGQISFSGLSTVRLDGRLTAAASARGATPGSVVIDPEELDIFTDQLWVGQNVTLEASRAIYVHSGVTISTRVTVDPDAAIFPFALPAGDAGDLTLRAPIIDIGERARLLANGGIGADGTVFDGGTIRLEAHAIRSTPGVFMVESQARVLIGAGAIIMGDSVTIEAVAESRLRAETLADLVNLGGLIPVDELADLAERAVDAAVTAGAALGVSALPARVVANATIDSQAGRIDALAGNLTISARATTDVGIAPDDARLSAIAVQSETTADVVLRSSSEFFPSVGLVAREQRLFASDLVTIEATTHEAQSLSARAAGPGAFALVFSHRTQRAQVDWRRGFVDTFFGPMVSVEGGGALVSARATRDLDLSAIAQGDVVAGALAVSLQDGLTQVTGGRGIRVQGPAGITLESLTREDRMGVEARAIQGGAPAPVLPDASSHGDAAATEGAFRAAGGTLESLSNTGQGTAGAASAAGVAIAGAVLRHDQTTRTLATGGSLTADPPGWSYDGPPPPSGPVTIRATTDLAHADVLAEARTGSALTGLLPVVHADLRPTTESLLLMDVLTSGDVTVSARTLLPGAQEPDAIDAQALAPYGGNGLTGGAALPGLSSLLPSEQAGFAARAIGPAAGVTLAAPVSVLRLDLRTEARIGDGQPFNMRIEGPYYYDYDDPVFPEAFFARRISALAETAGASLTTAGIAGAGQTAAGAGIAVTDLNQRTHALASGDLSAREITIDATPRLIVATVAAAGAGGASGVTGALAVTNAALDTVAQLAASARATVRAAPGLTGRVSIRARDRTSLLTLAGVGAGSGQVSAGLSAAINVIERDVRAALGSAFDLSYEDIDYYADRPILFDNLGGSVPDQRLDGLTLRATTEGAVLAAAAPGADDGLTLPADGPLRAAPTQAGGLSLAGQAALAPITLGSPDPRDPSRGAQTGIALSGAFAVTTGTSQVSTYLGTGGQVLVNGGVGIEARDGAAALALTGAAVGGAASGVAGGAGVVWLDRTAATRIYGTQVFATGEIAATAWLSGRDVAFGGSAIGAGLTGAAVAASAAVTMGERRALLRVGSATLWGGSVMLQAVEEGDVAAIAGAAEALESGTPRFGAGLAAALVGTNRSATVELPRFAARPEMSLPAPDPMVSLGASAGQVTVSAYTFGETLALARSAGTAGRFVLAASAAGVIGGNTATIDSAADLALGGPAHLIAQAAGVAAARAGADAAGPAGVGAAFAWQGETRSASIDIAGRVTGAFLTDARIDTLRATVTGTQSARAAGGAVSAPGNAAAINAAVAVNAAVQDARVALSGEMNVTHANIRADIANDAVRYTQAGGQSSGGAALGVGLGVALDTGRAEARVILNDIALRAQETLDIAARNLGTVAVVAANGDLGAATSIGVNVAAIAGSSAVLVDLGGTPPDPDAPRADPRAILTGTRVSIAAEDAAHLSATATAVQSDLPTGATGVVAGVAAIGGSAAARIQAQSVAMNTGETTLTATARPQISASSSGVDALRLDFAVGGGAFNLDIAAALGVMQANAAIDLRHGVLGALGTVSAQALSVISADVAGLLDASASIDADDVTITAGDAALTAEAIARVLATSTLTSARGAATRAGDGDTAAQIDAASAAAVAEDDTLSLALGATLTPQAARADAQVRVTESSVIATRALTVGARGETDVTLGAGGTALSATVAATETNAGVTVTESLLRSDTATLLLGAETLERQHLTARAPAAEDPLALAGVVSLRRGDAIVVVDNRGATVGLVGETVRVSARALRDLTFDARAAAGTGALAAGAVLSWGDGRISAGLGGQVYAATLELDAQVRSDLNVIVEGAGGVDTAAAGTPGLAGMDATGAALRRAADRVETRGTPSDAIEGTGGMVHADRLALALALVGQVDLVTAQAGGTVQGAGRSVVVLSGAQANTVTTRITASHEHTGLSLRARSFLGQPEGAPTEGTRAISAALTLFGQRSTTRVVVSDDSGLSGAGELTLRAATRLDPSAGDFNAGALRDAGSAPNAVALETAVAGAAPDPAAHVGNNWTIDQGASAAAESVLGADIAVAALDLTTEVVIAGTLSGASATADALLHGGISARAGAQALPAALGSATGQGLGAGIAATLLREVTGIRIEAGARTPGIAATAASTLRLLMLGQAKGLAAEAAFNGGLGVIAAMRTIRAVVDPTSRHGLPVSLVASDDAEIIAAGGAVSGSGALALGLGGALILGETTIEALYGRREGGVLLDVTGTQTDVTAVNLLAVDRSLLATLAAAGAGGHWSVPRGAFSVTAAWSALVGAIPGEQSGLAAALEAGGDRGIFGLGVSGAFAGVFGRTEVLAHAHGVALRPGNFSAQALGQGHVLALAGSAVSFSVLTNAIAGAAAVLGRDSAVIAQAQGLETAGSVTLDARQTRRARALAAGGTAPTFGLFSVAGSVALDVSASSAIAELSGADLRAAGGAGWAGAVSVTALTGGELTLLAGARSVTSALTAGFAAAQSEGSTTTRATLLNPVHIRADSVEVRATTRRQDRLNAYASAMTPLLGMFNIAGAVATDTSQVTAQAQMIGGIVTARDRLAVQALGTAGDEGDGSTSVSALREDFALFGAVQAGGARAEAAATRTLIAEAAGGHFTLAQGAGPDPMLLIRAHDAGITSASGDSIGGALGAGLTLSVSSSVITRRGTVAARLGAPMPATGAPPQTLLTLTTAGAGAAVQAQDDRSARLEPVQFAFGLATGLSLVVKHSIIDDTRAVTATVRDIRVAGAGRLDAAAIRSGALEIFSISADSSLVGGATLSGTLMRINSQAEVAARILGTQHASGGTFGGLGAMALDSGDLRAANLAFNFTANMIGARIVALHQGRHVSAIVGDSDTRISATALTGALSASATANGTMTAPSFGGGGSLGTDAGLVVTALASERNILAAVGGPVRAGSVSVSAQRAETLRVIDAEVSVAGAVSVTGRVGILRQSGATEARMIASGGTHVTGATSVTARDRSTVHALGFAANVALGAAAVAADFMFLDIGGGDALRADEGDAAARAQAALAAQARAEAAGVLDPYLPPADGVPNPLRATAASGTTLARIEGANLSVADASALGLAASRTRATLAGDVTVSATTDVSLAPFVGNVSATTGAGVTAGVLVARRGTQTRADIATTLTDGLHSNGLVRVSALSQGDTSVFALGASVAGGVSVAASLSLALDRREATAQVGGGVTARGLTVQADSDGDVIALGMLASYGGSVAVGAGVAIAVDDRTTRAMATDAAVTTTGATDDLILRATATGDTMAITSVTGAGGGVGVSTALSIALRSATTEAAATRAALTSARSVQVGAFADAVNDGERPGVTAVVVPVVVGGTVAVGAGVAVADWRGTTNARLTDSATIAQTSVIVEARANAELSSTGVGVAGGGVVGVAGSVAVSRRSDTVLALIDGGSVTATGSVAVLALGATGTESFAGASETEDDDTDAPVSSAPRRLAAVNVNIGIGGVVGAGVTVGTTSISGTVTAAIHNGAQVLARSQGFSLSVPAFEVSARGQRSTSNRLGVMVIADHRVEQTSLSVTGGAAGVVAGAVQITTLSVTDTVSARIGGDGDETTVTTQGIGSIAVQAQASADLRNFNMSVAGASNVGIGAIVHTISLNRTLDAVIRNANVNAARNLLVQAQAAEHINAGDLAGGGGLFAGVAGAVTVLDLNNRLTARVADARVTSGWDLTVRAHLDRELTAVLAGAALGIGVGSAGVLLVDLQDRILAELADDDAGAGAVVASVRNLDVTATTTQVLDARAGSLALGVGALQGTVAALSLDTDVRARIGTGAQVGSPARRAAHVNVTAETRLNPRNTEMLAVGQMSVAGFAYGAGVGVLSARSVTEAEVGARAIIRADGTVGVNALTDRRLASGTGAFNLTPGGSVQVVLAMTLVGDRQGGADDLSFALQPGLGLASDDTLSALGGPLTADGVDAATGQAAANATRNAAGVRLLARLDDSAVPVDADRTVARVGAGASIDALGSIGISAQDLTQATARGGGLGLGGALSAVAGVARVRVNSTISAQTLAGSSLTAQGGQIDIWASLGDIGNDRTALTRASAYAGTAGLVMGAASVADATATTSRRLRASLGAGSSASAALGVTVQADSQSVIEAATSGFALGTIAASAMRAQTFDTQETTATMAGTVTGSDLSVRANALGRTRAQTDALNLSLGFSGGTLIATATESSATTARLSGTVANGGRVIVRAEQARDVDVGVTGISASVLFAVGGTEATATLTRAVLADVTPTATVNASALTVRALHRGVLSADAENGGGALGVSVLGSTARVTLRGGATARLQAASLTTTTTDVEARSIHRLDVDADSTTIAGAAAGGAAHARADAEFDTGALVQTTGNVFSRLTVVAATDEGLAPTATGAGGGLGGLIGSDAQAISFSDTTVTLGGVLTVGALRVVTDHETRFAPIASSLVIAGVGLGGARSSATINTTSGITLAGIIRARDVSMDALARVLRGAPGRSAQAGSGGGFGAVGATATQLVNNTNAITLANGARLTQTGTGGVRMGVTSDVRLTPSAQITTFEALSLPRAEASATATNHATVTLGTGATLDAAGAVDIQTRSYGSLRASANADTTAAGSRIDAQASATYTADERITLAPGARIDSAGSIRLATGGGTDTPSLAEVGATATFRANSIVPLDRAPRASVMLALTSRIDIAAGAQVNAGGSVTLATRRIEGDALATGRGRNLWTDFANTVLDWIGASRDLEVDGIETATITDDTGSVVDGAVASGLAARVYLRYDQNGDFRASDAINAGTVAADDLPVPVEITQTDAATLRAQVLADMAAQRAALVAGGRTDLVQLLDLQIAEVTAQLDLLAARAGGGLIEVVRFGDIVTQGADIVVAGGYLRGSGDLMPTSELSVTLRVERPNAVTILGNIRVPDQPGRVIFNGLPVNSALGIAQINRDTQTAMLRDRAFEIGPNPLVIGWDTATPTLRVISAAGIGGAQVEVTALNDLYAAGNITNRAGLVRLALPPTGSASLIVQGNITAQTVELLAPNVIVGLTPGLRNVAGDPQAILFDRLGAPDLLANEIAPLGSVYTGFTPGDLAQGTPAILAQNVSIYGEYVNINGRIEAGGPTLTATISAATDAWINSVLIPSLTATSPERFLIHNPLTPTQGSGISGNLAVYYNTRTDRIEFDPIVAQGGQVRIAGNLISTGNGEIVVLDGFSNITVTSASTRIHRFDAVDTGGENGVQGRVELIDLRSRTRTVYTGIDTPLGFGATRRDMQRQVFALPAPGTDSAAITGTLTQTTTIAADAVTGARSTTWAVATIDGRVPFIDYVVRAIHTGTALAATTRTVGAPGVQERNLAGSAFYSYARSPSQTVQPTGVYDHQHSFRANESVAIRFIGERTGSISIDAGGSVELTAQVRSEGAGLSITAGGAILGRGEGAELRAAQISLITRSASAITGAALEPQSSIFRLDGVAVSLPGLLAQGLDLGALMGAGTLTVQAAPAQALRTSAFTGLTIRPEAPDLPLNIHLTDSRNLLAVGLTALTGTEAGTERGNIALNARESELRLTQVDGRRVTLSARGGIERTGGVVGAGVNGLEIRATRGLTLNSAAGSIGGVTPIRFALGDGRLDAEARGDIYLAHDPDAPFAQGALRVGQIVSNMGSVDLTSRGAILDDNDTGFRNRITEEAALAAFWENAGLLGAERTARITAEEEAQRAARQADFDLYWQVRDRLGGAPSKAATDALFGQIAEAAQAIGLTPEEAAAEAQRLRASYNRGEALSNAIDPAATERPDFTVTLTAAERNAIADSLLLTAADLDVALRRDYVVGTTATETMVEAPNIVAAGNVTLRASAVGEDRLVARILTGASGPVTPIAGVTDFNVDGGVPRDLLVLLATSEPADIIRRGFPASRTDIFRSEDLDLSVGGVVNILIHQGLHASVDASVYIGSEGSLTINQISARNRARVKVVGDILASTNAPGVAAQEIILEAQSGSVGSAARPIVLDAGIAGSAVDLDARAGGTVTVPGQIHLRRFTPGDLILGGIIASGSVDIRNAAGNLLARNTATFVEGPAVTLIASGRIGTRANGLLSDPANRPVNVRTPGALVAQAGTGLFVASDQTLSARSVGSDSGIVEIRVTQGDLRLDGARTDPANPASIQIAPAVYANTAITTGASSGPNDLILSVVNGRVLDAGSDTTFVNQGTPFSVPDIRAGRLVLFTGGFGSADNPIETDVGFIGGNARAGLFASNDRRQQPADSRGLLLGTLTAGQGAIDLNHNGQISLASLARVEAGGGLRLGATGDLTLLGDATLDAPNVVLDLPTGTLALPQAGDGRGRNLTVLGNLTANLRRLQVDGLNDALTSFAGGRIDVQGDAVITATEGITARAITGRNVTVTGRAPDLPSGGFGPAVNVALRSVHAEGDATLSATGDLRADHVQALGSADLRAGTAGVYGTLSVLDVVAGATARLMGSGLADAGVLVVTARTLTGAVGDVAAGQRLRLGQTTVVDNFSFGSAFGAPYRIEALAGDLTLRGNVTLGNARIETRALSIEGDVTGGDLDIVAIDGMDMIAGTHLFGGNVSVTVGGPLGGDFARRDADITMRADARITAQDTLSLSATRSAIITGLQSRRTAPGVGIDITAAHIVEAGDSWIDLTTNTGVIARLRADQLSVDPLTGMETQIGGADIVVGRGDILLRQVGDITVHAARTGMGRVDIFGFGDVVLAQGPDDTLAAPDSVVVTATGSLFTTAAPGEAVTVATRRLFLGAIEGSLGTQAAPLELRAGRQAPESVSLFAGRHIVGTFDLGPVFFPLLAADTGLIDIRSLGGGAAGIVTAAGPITADGLGAFPELDGVYDTRPTLAAVLEEARYPLRGTHRRDNGPFDATGADALPGDPLPPRRDASDGAIPPGGVILQPRDPAITRPDETALKDRAAAIAQAARAGLTLPGAPETIPGNPLQPFGTEYNRLRLTGAAAAAQEDRARANTTVTVAEELKKR